MGKSAPILMTPDQRGIWSLTNDQVRALEAVFLRYCAWQASNRAADPWASGAGKGIRYDIPRVHHGPPEGGYGPGTAAEGDDADPLLPRVHSAYTDLFPHQRAMLRLRWYDGLNMGALAERMQLSPEITRVQWRRLVTTLYYDLWGV
jgi:hypothetical protein